MNADRAQPSGVSAAAITVGAVLVFLGLLGVTIGSAGAGWRGIVVISILLVGVIVLVRAASRST